MKCAICCKEIRTLRGLSSHILRIHRDLISKEEYYRKYIMRVKEDECLLCGKKLVFRDLVNGYKYKFCNSCNRPKTKEEHIKAYGNLNKYYSEREKRSFSCSKEGLDRKHGEEKSKEIRKSMGLDRKSFIKKYGIKKFQKNSELKGKSTRRDYFLEQSNCNYDLADFLLKERQTTFSLEKCIEKYGEGVGIRVWKERQEKWQNTLKSKPIEEIERINKKKFPGYTKPYYMSEAERELSKKLKCSSQIYIKGFWYDLYLGSKIIEYNGDYWHCNPSIYDSGYYNEKLKMFAYRKWDLDGIKIRTAKESGYEIMVIWERDYKRNKNEVIEKCLEFLYGQNKDKNTRII